MIDYDIASQTYDHTRSHSDRVIERFAQRVLFTNETAILDFGCGTGNYLNSLQMALACRCCGVEPSEGMKAIAERKNKSLDIRLGDHNDVPFDEGIFDFAFMTNVIHHVPDLFSMFSELRRVLKPDGLVCVVTESHEQINNRFYNRYFPSLASNEKQRYPHIRRIVEAAIQIGVTHVDTEVLLTSSPAIVTESFVRNVEERNYSMFRLLDSREFAEGLKKVRADIGKSFELASAGETLIWFTKKTAEKTNVLKRPSPEAQW